MNLNGKLGWVNYSIKAGNRRIREATASIADKKNLDELTEIKSLH